MEASDLSVMDMMLGTQLPQLTNHGGPVIPNPQPLVVVWPGDETLGGQLNSFFTDLMSWSVWQNTMSQYGVGDGSPQGVWVLPRAAPLKIADADIATLTTHIASQRGRNDNELFVFIVPATSTLTTLGSDVAGYHAQNAAGIPYAVLPQLTPPPFGSNDFESLTYVGSHELAETVTNPYINTRPAWYETELGIFGEIADLCNFLPQYITAVADGGMPSNGQYLTARFYDNTAAARGEDPCAAAQTSPYFYISPSPRAIHSGEKATLTFVGGGGATIRWQAFALDNSNVVTPRSGVAKEGDQIELSAPAHATHQFSVALKATIGADTTYSWLLVSL
jgi:hypothetical protein